MILKTNIFFNVFLCYFLSLNTVFVSKINAQESISNNDNKICQSELPKVINNILNEPQHLSENWGILVKNTINNQVLYELNSHKYFIPASNNKLFTTASILLKRGENFKIKTPVYGEVNELKLKTLIIEGKGDPTIDKQKLTLMINKLQKDQIKSIDKLVLVDNYLPEPIINNSWEFSDIFYYYAVPVNSLILEENTVTLTINPSDINDRVLVSWSDDLAGSQWVIDNRGLTGIEDSTYDIDLNPSLLDAKLTITGTLASNAESDDWWLSVPKPADYFRDTLIDILTKNNIRVKTSEIISYQEYKLSNIFSNKKLIFEFISPSLKELITVTNRDSNNLYAEVLFKYLKSDNKSLDATTSATETLTELGVLAQDYVLKDGSGLSRQNLVTPRGLVSLLQLINNTKYRQIFRDSLAVAGVNGTLKNRFKDTDITNKLFAKTGTLSGVSALSGYLMLEDYDDLAFSIIVNQSTANSKSLRKAIDRIILSLGKIDKCITP